MAHRSRPDPELLQVVNDRLAHLLADRLPRRARGPASSPVPPDSPGRLPVAPGAVEAAPDEWLSDEVEPLVDLPPPRRFSRRHLGVVAGLLILALVCAGWALFRARPVAVASPDYPVTASTNPPAAPAATPGPTDRASAAEIVVHVLGAVRRPGLVRLPSGARVQDAIKAAGGLTRSADPDDLNLAQPLADGQQIVIGTRASPRRRGAGSRGSRRRARRRADPDRSQSGHPGPAGRVARHRSGDRSQHPGLAGAASALHPGRGVTGGGRHRPEDLCPDRSSCARVTSARPRRPGPIGAPRARTRPGHNRRGTICGWPHWPWRAGAPPGAAPRAARAHRPPRPSVRRPCWRSVRYAGRHGCWRSGW